MTVVEAATGKFVMVNHVDDRHVSGASTNPAGTKLAAITERSIYVWDLASENSQPAVYPAHLMGSPFKSNLEWIDDDHLLGSSHSRRVLYRLSLKLPIWSYEMDVRQYFLNRDPLVSRVVNGLCFYAAEPQLHRLNGSIAVGAVELPGPGVDQVVQSIDRDSLMILKPGSRIGFGTVNVTEPEKVKSWLKQKIEQNGWIYDENAEIKLDARMGRGGAQKVSYREFGIQGKTTVAQLRPHNASLKILKGGLIIWQSGTKTGAPMVVWGEDVQGEVDKYQTPQLGFFKTVDIDKEIIDPKYSRGFGVSRLGLRGIEVVSTSPPGREDDPFAASQQADEDRRKAAEQQGKSETDGESETSKTGR